MTIKEMERGYNVCKKVTEEYYHCSKTIVELAELVWKEGTMHAFEAAALAKKFAKASERVEVLVQTYGRDMVEASRYQDVDKWVKVLVRREHDDGTVA